jgi:hypothetical protein
VSVVPGEDGFRVVCNRDERRTRPAALPPAVRVIGAVHAILPIDGQSGGTWIAANDAGLVLALLNRSRSAVVDAPSAARSRGGIVPLLVRHTDLSAAVDDALTLSPVEFDPFELLVVQRGAVAILTSDRCRVSVALDVLAEPLVRTSSSLGDALVEAPRTTLFRQLVVACPPGQRRRAQRRFHRHCWSSHPELSVVMSRPDARTVSRTTVDIAAGRVRVRYVPLKERAIHCGSRLGGAP